MKRKKDRYSRYSWTRTKEVCVGCDHLGLMSSGEYVCVKCCHGQFVSCRPEEFEGMSEDDGGARFPATFEGNGVPPDCPRFDRHTTVQRLKEL